MNDGLERFGRKRSWLDFKILTRHSPGRAEENHKNPQSAYPVSDPRFEPATSRIRRRSTTTFGA